MHKFSLNISSCLFYIRGALPTYHGCGSGFLAQCPPDPDTDSEKNCRPDYYTKYWVSSGCSQGFMIRAGTLSGFLKKNYIPPDTYPNSESGSQSKDGS